MVSYVGWMMWLMSVGCTPSSQVPNAEVERRTVITVSNPMRWLVDQLAPTQADVRHLAPLEMDPQHWSPSGDLVAELANARLIFANGGNYEAWLATASFPDDALVNTSAVLDRVDVAGHTHSHGKGGRHSHGTTDPRTWMDPIHFGTQARVVAESLSSLYPESHSEITNKMSQLTGELDDVHRQYAAGFEALSDVRFGSVEPAYTYLFRRYNRRLEAASLHEEHEGLMHVVAWAGSKDPSVVFWMREPEPEAFVPMATVVHSRLDALDLPDASGYDYLRQSRANAARLRQLAAQLGD